MSVTLATGVTLIDFLNKSLETLKIVQKDDVDSNEIKLHLATLTQQLSITMVEAAQLQSQLAQKNEEIRQLKQQLIDNEKMYFDSGLWWVEGDTTPFCPLCKESENKKIHLVFNQEQPAYDMFPRTAAYWFCNCCNKSFETDA